MFGTVELLPAIVVGTVEPPSMLGTVELLPAIVFGTIDPPPAAVFGTVEALPAIALETVDLLGTNCVGVVSDGSLMVTICPGDKHSYTCFLDVNPNPLTSFCVVGFFALLLAFVLLLCILSCFLGSWFCRKDGIQEPATKLSSSCCISDFVPVCVFNS